MNNDVFRKLTLVLLFLTAVVLTVAMHGSVPARVFYGSFLSMGAAGWALARAFFNPSTSTELRSVAVSVALLSFSAAVRFAHSLS
jgi:hypothetical protein